MRTLSIFVVILFSFSLTPLSGLSVYASGTHEGGHSSENSTMTEKKSVGTDEKRQGHGAEASKHYHEDSKDTHNNINQTKETGHKDHSEDSDRSGILNILLPGLAGAPNIHPMLVHFPIVLLWMSLFFVGVSWFWKSDQFLTMAKWMFWLGLITVPITAGSGFWVLGGWGGGHVTTHRNLMLITMGLAFLLFGILRWLIDRRKLYRIVMTISLIVVVAFMTLGADRGAWLVFVKGSGVKPVVHVHNH